MLLPYAMARAAFHALNPQVLRAGADGDAIVPSSDGSVEDCDVSGLLDVDAVRVRALAGGQHLHSPHLHVLAVIHNNVKHLAV